MKKVFIIALLVSYSIASFGVTLNYFYCCGKLKTVSLTVKGEEEDCFIKSKKGCCENEVVTVKLKVDQKNNDQPTFHFLAPLFTAILYADNYSLTTLAASCNQNPLYKRPPPDNIPSRNVLYCVFRI